MAFYDYGEVNDETRDAILEDLISERRRLAEEVQAAACACGFLAPSDLQPWGEDVWRHIDKSLDDFKKECPGRMPRDVRRFFDAWNSYLALDSEAQSLPYRDALAKAGRR